MSAKSDPTKADRVRWFLILSDAQHSFGKIADSVASARQALALDEDKIEPEWRLARGLLKTKEGHEEAKKLIDAGLKRDDKSAKACYLMATYAR